MPESVSRRDFIKTSAVGLIGATNSVANVLDVRDFSAVGDGRTDNTAAIQKALNKAAETKSTVLIPDGIFACSTLKVPPFVGLCGNPT
jgi:polygalacturonase